jgi:asparagine synthase (glutamine-hydrolysing)
MCAIGGWVRKSENVEESRLAKMLEAMSHRGPDGQKMICSGNTGFVHARLAIQDRSDHSIQPFETENSTILFNGEIYNFIELRNELTKDLGLTFKSSGDFEVLARGLEHYGIDFIKRLNGEFAIAFYQKKSKRLFLIRDRLGIKPLYYKVTEESFVFSSEIRGIQAVLGPSPISPRAMQSYLAFRYVRGKETIYESILRVTPASYLVVSSDFDFQEVKYWTPLREEKGADPAELYELLTKSIRLRTRSEHSIGVLLSGGMDSSLIFKLAIDEKPHLIKSAYTFNHGTLQFPSLDASRARLLAEQLSVSHHWVESTCKDVNKVLNILEEPIGDAVILPLYDLLQKASREVRVLLSGEGADEIFYGYGHHAFLSLAHRQKALINLAVQLLSWSPLVKAFGSGQILYPARIGPLEVKRLQSVVSSIDHLVDAYHGVCEIFDEEQRWSMTQHREDLRHETYLILKEVESLSFIKKIIYLEVKTWLTNYNLMKLDKLAGGFGMEARVPFLDHNLVEAIFALPDSWLWSLLQRKPAVVDMCDRAGVPAHSKIPFVYNESKINKDWTEKLFQLKDNQEIDLESAHAVIESSGDGFLSQKMIQSLFLLSSWQSSRRTL